MGFLHKLWDDTVAGPTPDSGLGRLRKYNSFNAARSTAAPPSIDIASTVDDIPITRSITVVRSNANRGGHNTSIDSPTPPSSPAASSAPTSPRPFSPTSPGGNFKKFTRRKPKSEALSPHPSDSESKASLDWIVMQTALDH